MAEQPEKKLTVLTAGGAGKSNHKNDDLMKDQKPTNASSTKKPTHAVKAEHSPVPMGGHHHHQPTASGTQNLEYENNDEEQGIEDVPLVDATLSNGVRAYSDDPKSLSTSSTIPPTTSTMTTSPVNQDVLWLFVCFIGIMMSFVCYGLLLEYTTSGGRKLHELSFLFVTSGLYTVTAAAGRYVRDETPSTIPPSRFALLGLSSMGSTFCSVRSLRYVIFPIQVLAKSCKPVPVMLMGALLGQRYPMRKYFNVVMIVLGVALFMGGGENKKGGGGDDDAASMSSASQLFGILLLFVSLCFDGGTGAYEDKLMRYYQVQPFDLMFNIQLGKTILAGIGLLVFNQVHIFVAMVRDMGFLLVALGLTGAMGQVFIFVTIAKFGALTCSIIGLARKVTTLVASIIVYGHALNGVQFFGLAVSVSAMVLNFWGKKKGGGGHHGGGHHGGGPSPGVPEEMEKMLKNDDSVMEGVEMMGDKTTK